jgi:mRNA interferase MazF
MRRGEVWWASLRAPKGSDPGYRRPVVVVQANEFNESRISTVLCVVVTSNERLAAAPGNVRISGRSTGIRSGSVLNVSQLITVDKMSLTERIGRLSAPTLEAMDAGLRLVLAL